MKGYYIPEIYSVFSFSQERKRTPSVYTMVDVLFVCRSIPKLLGGKTTWLCQSSETCHHYRVLHNLGLAQSGCTSGHFSIGTQH